MTPTNIGPGTGSAGGRQSLSANLAIQLRIISSLVLRELHTRYGRENIGFLWVIVEPMILGSVVAGLHFSSNHYSSDIAPIPFIIVGYVIFIMFRNTFNRGEGAIELNQPLLYHRHITPFDIIFARAIMDIAGCLGTLVALLSLAILVGYASPPARPLELLTAALLMCWFSMAMTMIAATLSYRNELVGRQLHVISYLSIRISGAFFQLEWLPPSIRDKLAWSPLPLIFEQARYGQFFSAKADYVDPLYVVAWNAGLTYLALVMIRRMRSRIYG